MRLWKILVPLGALALPGPEDARAFDAGSVHQERCVACHARVTGGDGHVLYRGTRGIVANAAELRARVDHCREGAGLDWTGEQIDAMRDFLDKRFYRFGKPRSESPDSTP